MACYAIIILYTTLLVHDYCIVTKGDVLALGGIDFVITVLFVGLCETGVNIVFDFAGEIGGAA